MKRIISLIALCVTLSGYGQIFSTYEWENYLQIDFPSDLIKQLSNRGFIKMNDASIENIITMKNYSLFEGQVLYMDVFIALDNINNTKQISVSYEEIAKEKDFDKVCFIIRRYGTKESNLKTSQGFPSEIFEMDKNCWVAITKSQDKNYLISYCIEVMDYGAYKQYVFNNFKNK